MPNSGVSKKGSPGGEGRLAVSVGENDSGGDLGGDSSDGSWSGSVTQSGGKSGGKRDGDPETTIELIILFFAAST